jgi:hypothetical protein
MSNITLDMTLDESRMVAAFLRAADAQKKVEGGSKKLGDELKKAGKEAEQVARDLDAFAKKTTAINATPLERYRGEMEKLDRAFKSGKISQETFQRATERAKVELSQAGQASDKSFGAQALAQLGSYAAGMLSISAAAGVVKQGLELVAAAREKALGSSEGLDAENMNLSHLSEGQTDKERADSYAKILAERDRYATKYGLDRVQASRTLFNAKSAGFTQEETEAAMQSGMVMNAQSASSLMVKSKEAFKGDVTGREALNMALSAAKKTQVDAEGLASSLPNATVSAKGAGFDFAESAAMVAKGADRFKNVEQASDRFSALFAKLEQNEKYRGKGMEAIKELISDDAKAKEFAGDSKEINQALNVLRDEYENIQKLTQELRAEKSKTGTKDDFLNVTSRTRFSDATERAKLAKRQAKNYAEIEREKRFAEGKAYEEAAAERSQGDIESQNKGIVYRTGEYFGGGTARNLGAGEKGSSFFGDFVGRSAERLVENLNPFNSQRFNVPYQAYRTLRDVFGARQKSQATSEAIQKGVDEAAPQAITGDVYHALNSSDSAEVKQGRIKNQKLSNLKGLMNGNDREELPDIGFNILQNGIDDYYRQRKGIYGEPSSANQGSQEAIPTDPTLVSETQKQTAAIERLASQVERGDSTMRAKSTAQAALNRSRK